jgi:hypothetical protein
MADAGELKAVINVETSEFIAKMHEIAETVGQATNQAADRFDKMQNAIDGISKTLNEASDQAKGFGESLLKIGEMAGVVFTLEKVVELVKEFATEAIEASSNVEFLTKALTSLTGSASAAENVLSQAAEIASRTTASFMDLAKAAQGLAAIGVSAGVLPSILEGIAEWSEVSGRGLESLENAMQRIYLTGDISARTLKTLGLSMQDLANAAGVSADQIKGAIKELGPESDTTMELIATAMREKGEKAAKDLAETHRVAVNNLKTKWHEFATFVGDEIQPALTKIESGLAHLLSGLTPQSKAAQDLERVYGGLAGQLREAAAEADKAAAAAANQAFVQQAAAEAAKKAAEEEAAARAKAAGISTIGQLKQMGLIPEEAKGELAAFDKQAQSLFDDFYRGFQGIEEEWNQAAAGIDPEKLLARLQELKAKFQQAGDTGSLGYLQVTDAARMLGDWLANNLSPDVGRTGQDIERANAQAIKSYDAVIARIDAVKPPLDAFGVALKQLGIDGEGASVKLGRDFAAVGELLQNSITNVGDLDAAWVRLTEDARKFANDPALLPKIIALQQQIVDELTAQGAPLGEIYNKTEQILREEINLATLRGQNASGYMIQLKNLQIQQQILIDQSQQMGRVYGELMQDFDAAFTSLGKGIADNIVDAKNWGEVFTGIVKNIAKSILETLVGEAFKALENAILKNTNLLSGLAQSVAGLFSGGRGGVAGAAVPAIPGSVINETLGIGTQAGSAAASAASSAGSAASTIAGSTLSSVTGIVGAVGAVGTMISSIISNFQLARQETTLNAIELNTRQTAMFIGGLGGGGVQDWAHITAVNTTPLLDINTWIHDAWMQLLDNTARGTAGGGGAGGAIGSITINVNGAQDAAAIANEIAAYLRNISPKFAP